jgi:uncharacterized protein (TIGR02145 family)
MKTSNIFLSAFAILIIIMAIIFSGCKKDEVKIVKQKLSGQVQKGPYINGTTILLSELNSSLDQTGKIFTTQIVNNSGSFEINNVTLNSRYAEFSANGYFYDEVYGTETESPLFLYGFADINDISTVNINVLTHLERPRVKYLVNQGKTFAEAKKTAQAEVLAMFGFSLPGMKNSEALDISLNSEEDAVLLSISIIVLCQSYGSVADLTKLLAYLSNNIRETGIIQSDSVITQLKNSARYLQLPDIRSNLESRYHEFGIDASIPDFEKYILEFIASVSEKPTIITKPASEIGPLSANLYAQVNPHSLFTTVNFEYGLTTAYGNKIPIYDNGSLYIDSLVFVSVGAGDLLPRSTYHYRAVAENMLGISYGDDMSFTTTGRLPVISPPTVFNLHEKSVMLAGYITAFEMPATYTFEWGLTTDYGNSSNPRTIGAGFDPVRVGADLSDLSAVTLYHFRYKVENKLGAVYSEDATFTTTGQMPTASASPPVIGETSVRFNGSVNPNFLSTTVIFEWGITETYGNSVPANESPLSGVYYAKTVSANLNGLSPATAYHFRIKATNEVGSAYGSDMVFTTVGVTSDIDGNIYSTVLIGNQVWFAKNLMTTRYQNGDIIGTTTPATLDISGEFMPKYQWAYDGNESSVAVYGRLYTWYAATDTRNICPVGWRVSTDTDWWVLLSYLGGYNVLGGIIKETGLSHWQSPNTGAINNVGFTALPGGGRISGTFMGMGTLGLFWKVHMMNYTTDYLLRIYHDKVFADSDNVDKSSGGSVRCIMNN